MSAPVVGPKGRAVDPLAGLSPHQMRLANLIAEGLSNPQIAARFSVSVDSLKSQIKGLMGVLGVRNRVQVAALVAREGTAMRREAITALLARLHATGLDAGQCALVDQLSALVTGSRS